MYYLCKRNITQNHNDMKKQTEQKNKELTLLSVYNDDLRRLKSRVGIDRSASTWKSLSQGRDYVERYLKECCEVDDICLDAIVPQFISDFSIFMSTECGLRNGTVWLACQQLKGVVTRAHQRGFLSWNPFASFHISKNIRPREYLSEEELRNLIDYKFKKSSLVFARDVFVFSAFTGLSFIDIKELKKENIKIVNGAKWILSERHKTKTPFQVKLLNIPLSILNKYEQQGTFAFKNMEYRTMAKRIRKVIDEVGIQKNISYHCARHTFAVMALNKGMPIESLSRILGHTNIATTQIYAKITLQKLDSDMTKLAERITF